MFFASKFELRGTLVSLNAQQSELKSQLQTK